MPDVILEKRGLFWPSHFPLRKNQFARSDSIAGGLTITEDGRISLRLDGVLQPDKKNTRFPLQPLPKDFKISGVLFETHERICLLDIVLDGGSWSSDGPSYDQLWALVAIVGISTKQQKEPKYRGIRFSLDGYQDWFHKRNVARQRKEDGFAIDYSRPESISYQLRAASITIEFDASVQGTGIPYNQVKIDELASIEYKLKRAASISAIMGFCRAFDDLFLVLTNLDRHLIWPKLIETNGAQRPTLYYMRGSGQRRERSHLELWTWFPQLRERFGDLVERWFKRREELGSAFYLFTGTRRASFLYSEHNFVSFVWGLESFQRATSAAPESNGRIERILGQVQSGADRRWLKGKLKHANEPTLEQRLIDILKRLPIKFDRKELQEFSRRCATRRNDISHFGHARDFGEQAEFYNDLQVLTRALDPLYHATILQEIGLPEDLLRGIFLKNYGSFFIREDLKRAGLSKVE